MVDNQDGERLFLLNGIQTQSGDRYNLINAVPTMTGLVDVVRLSPQPDETFEWLERFRLRYQDGVTTKLAEHDCNGYWHRLAGIRQLADD